MKVCKKYTPQQFADNFTATQGDLRVSICRYRHFVQLAIEKPDGGGWFQTETTLDGLAEIIERGFDAMKKRIEKDKNAALAGEGAAS